MIYHGSICISQVASLENWAPIMYQAMNSTQVDEQPVLNGNPYMAYYFISFIVVCVYFMLNLVIGVAIDQVRGSVIKGPSLLSITCSAPQEGI